MADPQVNPDGIRSAAKALVADGGPITYLQNAEATLAKAHLSGTALSLFGMGTVSAHNEALRVHDENIKSGIQRLHDAARTLSQTADHWEKSDEPWVVKR